VREKKHILFFDIAGLVWKKLDLVNGGQRHEFLAFFVVSSVLSNIR